MEEVLDLSFDRLLMMMMILYQYFLWRNSPNRAQTASFEVSRSHTVRHTQPVGLWTSDQFVEESANYKTLNKHKTTSILQRDLKPES